MATNRIKSYIKENPRRVIPMAVIVLATSALGIQLLLQSMAAVCQPQGQIAKSVKNLTTNTPISDANNASSAVQARTGDIVQYTVKVVNLAPTSNSGYNDMYNVKISDTLPAGVESVSNPANRTVLLHFGTIAAGKSSMQQFNVRVTSTLANVMINNRACYTSESKYAGADNQSGCDFALVHVKGSAVTTPTPTPTPTPGPSPHPTPTPSPVSTPTPVHSPSPSPTPTSTPNPTHTPPPTPSPVSRTPSPSPSSPTTSPPSAVATTTNPGTEQTLTDSSGVTSTEETALASSQNSTGQTSATSSTSKSTNNFWNSPWRWLLGLLLVILAGVFYAITKRRNDSLHAGGSDAATFSPTDVGGGLGILPLAAADRHKHDDSDEKEPEQPKE